MALTLPDLSLPDRTWVKLSDQPGYAATAGAKVAIENKSDTAKVYVVYGGAAAPAVMPTGMALAYGEADAQSATQHWVCSVSAARRGASAPAGLVAVTIRD